MLMQPLPVKQSDMILSKPAAPAEAEASAEEAEEAVEAAPEEAAATASKIPVYRIGFFRRYVISAATYCSQ